MFFQASMFIQIVGSIYIVIGVGGVLSNALVAFLLSSTASMRKNPTYVFMANLAAADAIVLVSIAFYAGIHCLNDFSNESLDRAMAWVVAVGWYPGCMFFVLIAFSRYIALTKHDKLHTLFNKTTLTLCVVIPWVVCSSFYLCFVLHPKTLFVWYPAFLSWGFDEDSSTFGYYLQKQNTATNILFATVQTWFNVQTLVWLHRTRNQSRSVRTSKNRKREIKLFIQCFINGCVFTIAAILYALFYAVSKHASVEHFVVMHLAWIAHHLVNPVIYFIMNKKLRQIFVDLCCPLKCVKSWLTVSNSNCRISNSNIQVSQTLDEQGFIRITLSKYQFNDLLLLNDN